MLVIKKLLEKNETGFTLVELVAVVVIIGILLVIAIPMYSNSSASAKAKTCKNNIETINKAISKYLATTTATLTTDPACLVNAEVLKSNPICPVTNEHYTINTTTNKVIETGHFTGGYETAANHD